MAISRSLMNRQLRADGGIMQVAPREKFGLGSKLKKFVRKIIPNEISEIAVKAAPFVAPFNPLLAAGMSGIGSFDQTGRIGDSLKSGALTYGLGQGARYLGGAEFQGLQNPFTREAFSMPTGSGGIKNLFKKDVQAVQGVGDNTKLKTSDFAQDLTQDLLPGDTVSTVDLIGDSGSTFSNFVDYGTDLLKKGAKAAFTKADGSIDKAAVIGAATAAASYAEALMLARNAGVELSEEEYNQAQADEKREEYAGYLKNFFGGKKDGGRIGYADGPRTTRVGNLEIIVMPGSSQEKAVVDGLMNDIDGIVDEDTKMDFYRTLIPELIYSGEIQSQEGMKLLQELGINMKADGGRIGYAFGSEPKDAEVGIMTIDVEAGDDDDMDMDMDMAMAFPKTIFSSSEISRLFSDRSLTTNLDRKQLYKVLMNPGMFPEGEKMLIKMLRGKKEGGRIGFAEGSEGMLEVDAYSTLLKNVDTVYEKVGIPSSILQEHSNWESEKLNMFDTMLEYKSWLDTNYPKSPIGTYLYHLPKEEKMDIVEKISIKKASGGRVGLKGGANRVSELLILRDNLLANGEDVSDIEAEIFQLTGKTFKSVGGISDIPTGNMRKNNAGVVERDYRDEGGFVPVGIKERADDVPAMLSKNEFVMTADAVRGIGNGSVEEGSKKLYNTMKQAEKVGKA